MRYIAITQADDCLNSQQLMLCTEYYVATSQDAQHQKGEAAYVLALVSQPKLTMKSSLTATHQSSLCEKTPQLLDWP